jgi:hypothetical protein
MVASTRPGGSAARVREGFKVFMTAYQPEEHVEVVQAIRQAVRPWTALFALDCTKVLPTFAT